MYILDIGGWLITSVVIVSGAQQRDPAPRIHVSILSQTALPSRCHLTLSRIPCVITNSRSLLVIYFKC